MYYNARAMVETPQRSHWQCGHYSYSIEQIILYKTLGVIGLCHHSIPIVIFLPSFHSNSDILAIIPFQ